MRTPLVLILSLGYPLYLLLQLWGLSSLCPYPDFLSWDGDLRFVTTLKFLKALESFDGLGFLGLILDSPTWPVLRNLFSIPFFYAMGVKGETEILLTYLSFFSLFPLSFFLFHSLRKKLSDAFLGVSLLTPLLFSSPPFLLYTSSPMLEVQGSFFFLLSVFSFHRFLNFHFHKILPAALSIFLLYQTKYPYGYIFLFLIFLFLFYENPPEFIGFVKRGLKFLISDTLNRTALIAMTLLIFLPRFLTFFKQGKSPRYLLFLTGLIGISILLKFVGKESRSEERTRFETYQLVLKFFFLPVLVWTLSHPDRLGSSGGTISHVQMEGFQVGVEIVRDWKYWIFFLKTLGMDVWFSPFLGWTISGIQILILIHGFLRKRVRSLAFVLSLFVWLSVLGLTFLTPNHQARHVYHLIPALLVSSILGGMEFLSPYLVRVPIFIGIWIFSILSQPVLSLRPYLCFGGVIPIYGTPIFFEKNLSPMMQGKIFLFSKMPEEHLNHADTELVFARKAYELGAEVEFSERKFLRNIDSFQKIISAGKVCGGEAEKEFLEKRVGKTLLSEMKIESEEGCLESYHLIIY